MSEISAVQPMRLLDLFSGIGGFSLGLERSGAFKTVAFCEIEPFCRRVLKKHWPKVPIYEDVRSLTADALRRDGIAVDAICGGFPCQDISTAGKGAGIEGGRSGLWSEYARLIGELRPRYAIVENVSALLGRDLGRVLGDLAAIGYDAEWHCIPASAVGAPHRRDRIWIVSYSGREQRSEEPRVSTSEAAARQSDRPRNVVSFVANSDSGRFGERYESERSSELVKFSWRECDQWITECRVGRVVNGISSRVDRLRLRGLGNAVVPQIPELIGHAIAASLSVEVAA